MDTEIDSRNGNNSTPLFTVGLSKFWDWSTSVGSSLLGQDILIDFFVFPILAIMRFKFQYYAL